MRKHCKMMHKNIGVNPHILIASPYSDVKTDYTKLLLVLTTKIKGMRNTSCMESFTGNQLVFNLLLNQVKNIFISIAHTYK